MADKTFFAAVLLGLLATASCQPPQPLVYDSLEVESADKQLAQIGSQIFGLIRPFFSNALGTLTSNLGTAFSNAFGATVAGKKLALITIESLESATPETPGATHSYTPGGEPPKRRPYTRAMALGEDKPLQSSDPTISSSS